MTESVPKNESGEEKTDIEKILDYFLSFYKAQVGLHRQASTEIKKLGASSANAKLITYELRVSHRDDWMSRRFSLGPIGEDSGSKSKCFLAIYDNKLVLKIPPTPVTDFEKYIKSIEKDRRIVDKLAPRESIVPSVSVILRKIHKFSKDGELSGLARENAYLEWLRENPEYQEYLKIDGSFAFFMDLSEYVFLADAIALFDPLGKNLQEELLRDPSIIDDFEKFEGRYGLENAQIGMDLKSIYEEYEEQVRKLMIQAGASPSVLLYKIQYWFFLHIAGKTVKNDKKDLTDGFVKQLNKLIRGIVSKETEVIDEYRDMARAFLQDTSFTKQKTRMEGIAANTLELLSWLRQKGIAMRDIKPDNLLVAGDPTRYPNFLSTPESFSIGLIDVETAVDVASADGRITQPLLGGTPFYATPTHMFSNKVLLQVYKDLPRTLLLQDWFAVMAMIYGTIVGRYLFDRTAKVLVLLTKKIQKIRGQQPADQVLRKANKEFWRSAKDEFQENMHRNEDQLRAIKALIQEPVQEMLVAEIMADSRLSVKRMNSLIKHQTIFKNTKNREQLRQAAPAQIADIIKKLSDSGQVDANALAMLENIRQLKMAIKDNQESVQLLGLFDSGFSIYNVLELMFNIIYNGMVREQRFPRA